MVGLCVSGTTQSLPFPDSSAAWPLLFPLQQASWQLPQAGPCLGIHLNGGINPPATAWAVVALVPRLSGWLIWWPVSGIGGEVWGPEVSDLGQALGPAQQLPWALLGWGPPCQPSSLPSLPSTPWAVCPFRGRGWTRSHRHECALSALNSPASRGWPVRGEQPESSSPAPRPVWVQLLPGDDRCACSCHVLLVGRTSLARPGH